jgi:large conductance mechanosensitive channel
MKLVDEFKAFAMKGNVVDMAVGIIIGAAFGKIIASMVSDVLMPPLGLLIGGVTFTDLKFIMKAAVGDNPAVTLNYGNFLQVVFDFLIVAVVVFNKRNQKKTGSTSSCSSCAIERRNIADRNPRSFKKIIL